MTDGKIIAVLTPEKMPDGSFRCQYDWQKTVEPSTYVVTAFIMGKAVASAQVFH